MADKLEWAAEAKDRGNRIIARLCGISQRSGGNRLCKSPWLECSDYPEEHAESQTNAR